jgi:hypothetical protein
MMGKTLVEARSRPSNRNLRERAADWRLRRSPRSQLVCYSSVRSRGPAEPERQVLFAVLREHHIRRRDDAILLMMAVESAVLDVETDEKRLRECLALLDAPHLGGLVSTPLGKFGPFDVMLNIYHDDSLSVFVDGPDFEESFNQSAAIWLSKEDMRRIIGSALSGVT